MNVRYHINFKWTKKQSFLSAVLPVLWANCRSVSLLCTVHLRAHVLCCFQNFNRSHPVACCNSVAVLLQSMTQRILNQQTENLAACFSYSEPSSGQQQNEVLVIQWLCAHRVHIHWMYQDFVLLLAWWWLVVAVTCCQIFNSADLIHVVSLTVINCYIVLLCFSLPSMYVTTAGVETLKSPCCFVMAVMIVTTRFV